MLITNHLKFSVKKLHLKKWNSPVVLVEVLMRKAIKYMNNYYVQSRAISLFHN